MSTAATVIRTTDRQDIATRLLASSAKKAYDPMVEVDWTPRCQAICTE